MAKLKPTDPSHTRLIRAVEQVSRRTPLEALRNPRSLGALAIKIMTRDRNGISIPNQYQWTAQKTGYRHWQDVMVQLFRQSRM